ncbi:MAG TPA: alkaline phosphatase family protein [Methylomirabilota bacterium]|nr:alkaline phosphatase family protein [Methylomirabilota bacterium]
MALDELVLALQRRIDRAIRRLRLGPAPERGARKRLLVVQIDGLARDVLERALAEGRMPFLERLLRRERWRMAPMSVGLPTSTPAFQMGVFYGVRPDIPGFHYHDKRRRSDIYFPRGGDAAHVEATQAAGRRGILEGGSAYACVFTGGAVNNLFNFATLKRPTGHGLLRVISAFVVLTWVVVKCLALTGVELTRALLRFVADPVGETRRGWKWLALKIGLSVWLRELFTLAVSRDLYAGAPAVYVNYLDYDVFAHAFGPRHRRALRSLRHVDSSLRQLWRVIGRVPGHRYEMYVLSDHGQTTCRSYRKVSGGQPIERVFFEEFFRPAGMVEVGPAAPRGRRLAAGIEAFRSRRAPGMFQRFANYLERDFPKLMGELPESRERDGVRVIGAGPNAFVYFLDHPDPLTIDDIDERFPGLADEIGRSRGVGFVLARSRPGPLCLWRGKRYALDGEAVGPFAGRADWPLVAAGVRDLMAMRCAGDLVIYGHDSPDGNISYVAEIGAHAGPSPEEMECFVLCRPGIGLPEPLTHPTQLYPHFAAYQRD